MKMRIHARCAFTLLELLLAIGLAAGLFVAVNQFVFSMAELWGAGAERRLFERHAGAVTRCLQAVIEEGCSRPADRARLAMQDEPGQEGAGRWLTFELPAGSRLLVWPRRPLPDVVCSLQLRPGEGLLLRWLSRLEPGFGTGAARTVVLSPFGTRLEYEYYDGETRTWIRTDRPRRDQRGGWALPDRLRIQFARDGITTAHTLALPRPGGGLPAF